MNAGREHGEQPRLSRNLGIQFSTLEQLPERGKCIAERLGRHPGQWTGFVTDGEGERRLMATATVVKGLEGVVAANSGICWIDGYAGVLAYRGIDIHELADHSTFEETTYLLWHGKLPDRAQLDEFSQKLAEARRIPSAIYDLLRRVPKTPRRWRCCARRFGAELLRSG